MSSLNFLLFLLLFALLPLTLKGEEPSENDDGPEEARTALQIEDERLGRFDLRIDEVGPAKITQSISAPGRIVPVDGRLAKVSPRFAGVIKEISAHVGDHVKPETALAVVQNNQNLQTFTLRPAISGMVIGRRATVGEVVNEASVMFVVADLSELWAELATYKDDFEKVRIGQKVALTIAPGARTQYGELVFISPITDERTQSRTARVRLQNPQAEFSPGVFVDARIVTEETEVALAVDASALQQIEGKATIFVRVDDGFAPRPIIAGRTDGRMTEVLDGLELGMRYATGNTFILKADLGKDEMEDDD